MSSSNLSNVEASKENVSRPKRAKRKLYTNEISSPLDISGQVVSWRFTLHQYKLPVFLFCFVFSRIPNVSGTDDLNLYCVDHIS